MRNLRRRHRSSGVQRATSGVLLFGAGAGTAWLATYLDKRRRHVARDRVAAAGRKTATAVRRNTQYAAGVATGVAHTAAAPMRSSDREYDDVTLARKVETEIFRPPDAPKDRVSVNVQHGIVELRGEVAGAEDVESLGAAAQRVEGVKEVHNLLHTPGSPPKHSPPSDPAEVRERADAATGSSA
jgi:osmotically-inducible protein OsmY